jgi:cysteine synthase A
MTGPDSISRRDAGRRRFLRGSLTLTGLPFALSRFGAIRAWERPFALMSGLATSSFALAQTKSNAGVDVTKAPREGARPLPDSAWTRQAIRTMWAERRRSGVTPLVLLQPPFDKNLRFYLKDETKSPTGTLKHRVAWGLVMSALVDGSIGPETHLYEASSGNTAIGEAYFAKVLGLKYTAVVRPGISGLKIKAIKSYGGDVAVAPEGVSPGAHLQKLLTDDQQGYDFNQFANTQKVLDHFDAEPDKTMNMAAEIFRQLEMESQACPAWFVAGAGSGGTATSLARYLRKWADFGGRSCTSSLAVVDPEDSVLFDWYLSGNDDLRIGKASRIEGIGSSGPVIFGNTFSLLRRGVDEMFKVPDNASLAAMRLLSGLVGFDVGPSSGTNFYGALRLLDRMHRQGRAGAVVSIICDEGSRYRDKYFNPAWIGEAGLDPAPWKPALSGYWETGQLRM